MNYVIYVLAGLSVLLALGGLSAYASTKHVGLLLSSVVSIACAVAAVALISFWPLVFGFGLNWVLKLAGFDPGARR